MALSTLFGFFLLSVAYISFGMFASSLTENQIVAAVITICSFLAMWFIPYVVEIFNVFSLITAFEPFILGIISLESVITFVSFSLMCILLTIITLQRRKSVK